MFKFAKLLVIMIFVIGIAGCATNRGYLDIKVPQGSLINPNGKQVYIRAITDNRQFQDKPKSADTPSLGYGGVEAITPELKSRAIARKRNTYGKALGDIFLEEGQSVQSIIYEATRNALFALGYEVTNAAQEARPDAIIIDINVDKFWAWFMPGFWTLSLKSEIATTNMVGVPQRDSPIIIEAESRNYCQVANEANWRKTINMVVDDFIKKAELELRKLEAQ